MTSNDSLLYVMSESIPVYSGQHVILSTVMSIHTVSEIKSIFIPFFIYLTSLYATSLCTVEWVYDCVQFLVFFLISWGGARLSLLGTSAAIWPIVPALNDRWWMWNSRWNENWQEKPKYSWKTCPIATLSTINLSWSDLGSNPGRRGGKSATNRLSYDCV
jgi:hypothetical protein